eukprot:5538368-Amphidinium_carterae.1
MATQCTAIQWRWLKIQCDNSSAAIVCQKCRDSAISQSAMRTLSMLMTMMRVRVTTLLVTQLERILPNRLLNFDYSMMTVTHAIIEIKSG